MRMNSKKCWNESNDGRIVPLLKLSLIAFVQFKLDLGNQVLTVRGPAAKYDKTIASCVHFLLDTMPHLIKSVRTAADSFKIDKAHLHTGSDVLGARVEVYLVSLRRNEIPKLGVQTPSTIRETL